jgi:signal transduction histidine kinase
MSQRKLHDLLRALQTDDSLEIRDVLRELEAALRSGAASTNGARVTDELAARLAALATHSKWEVRKAVAHVAQYLPDEELQRALAPLLNDSNSLVRDAAQTALSRFSKRPSESASAPRSDAVARLLASIEVRWGPKARDAANRFGAKETERFVREVVHELDAIVSSLDSAHSSVTTAVKAGSKDKKALLRKTTKVQERIDLLSRVLESLRAFVTQGAVEFHPEGLRDMLVEAAGVVRDGASKAGKELWTEIEVPPEITLDAHRGKLVQAFRNVIQNGLEAYDGLEDRLKKIRIKSSLEGETEVSSPSRTRAAAWTTRIVRTCCDFS